MPLIKPPNHGDGHMGEDSDKDADDQLSAADAEKDITQDTEEK